MTQATVDLGISPHRMETLLWWMHQFARDWTIQGEVPLRIHDSGMGQAFGLGSAPPFAPEFIGYIGALECKVPGCKECSEQHKHDYNPYTRNHQTRTRTTRAFRKLRRFAPREFDAVYMAVVHQKSLAQISSDLNDRAYARGFDDVYSPEDVLLLIVSGMDKLMRWW